MATSLIFGVFAVPALVLYRPDTSNCDYDFYVRYAPDGRIRTLLSLRGKPLYNALDHLLCFCMSLSIVLTINALLTAPKTPFSDAMWALWLLVILMRLAHHAIFRSWHFTGSHWAILCCALMLIVQTLACVFAGIIGFALVSSSLTTLVCLSVVPVLVGLAGQLAATCYVTNYVRVSKHLYDVDTRGAGGGVYTVSAQGTATGSDQFGERIASELNEIH